MVENRGELSVNDEIELSDKGTVCLTRVQDSQVCKFGCHPIQSGGVCVCIKPHSRLDWDYDWFYVCLDDLEDFISTISTFECELGEFSGISKGNMPAHDLCIICGEPVNSSHISFTPKNLNVLHFSCVEEFMRDLSSAWQYSNLFIEDVF